MTKRIIIFIIIILLIAFGIFYWSSTRNSRVVPTVDENGNPITFEPINRGNPSNTPNPSSNPSDNNQAPDSNNPEIKLPALRHLSTFPVGGFMASTTGSDSVVRFIDRGVGHVYESLSNVATIEKLSNTTIPRIYESYWNRSLNTAILRYTKDTAGAIANFYAEIRPVKNISSTTPDTTPYEIKGKFLSPSINGIAVSPKADQIFTLNIENGRGMGYISAFDESKKVKILDTPLTQLTAEWPETNTIAINTKASGVSSGYLYFLDPKKATFKKILGGITGLTTKVSADAKKVIYTSGASPQTLTTKLFNVKDGSTQDVIFKTLAEKCVWSKIRPTELYCAVPTDFPSAMYPDDWYKGNVSFTDQIWHLDSVTGEVHLMANLLNLSNSLIDATNLALDPKENFLYFTNKRDLTLWSLDLNQ